MASPVNGHLSPDDADMSTIVAEPIRIDADVPDTVHSLADGQSPSPTSSTPEIPIYDASGQVDGRKGPSQSDESSEHDAPGDADFDARESVPSPRDADADVDRESSSDSIRPSKRKAPVSEDDFIKANPELYGLRRSVSCG